MKIFTKTIDETAKNQLSLIENSEAFKDEKIRVMPDCHSGKGCVIGFTSTIGNKIIPNVVGVDIGCGVMHTIIHDYNFDIKKLDEFLKGHIPSGKNIREPNKTADGFIHALRCEKSLKNLDRIRGSLGTLGGGNHFIEVDESPETKTRFLVVHTGSRNLGAQVAEYYQNKAIENLHKKPREDFIKSEIARLKSEGKQKEIEPFLKKCKYEKQEYSIPDELCYLEGKDMDDYLWDMDVCQQFAYHNRKYIVDEILNNFFNIEYIPTYYDTVHNYIDFDDKIIRKGAIRAERGMMVIIPLNMRDGCIIGTGKGNYDWNCSAPHGAGRLMSRSEARRSLKLEDFNKAMSGIYTTTANQNTIDESPMAYKNAKEIIDLIGDTVSVEQIIKPIYNFKAEE